MGDRGLPLALAAGALRSPLKRLPPPGAAYGAGLHRAGVRPDPRRLAAYARLCGFPPPGEVPLPYPHLLGFPLALRLLAAPAFPLPLLGLVHTRISVTRHRALAPDEPLDLTVAVAGPTAHHRGSEADVTTEAYARDGALVWESTSGYLARHATGEARPPEREAPAALPVLAEWRLPADLGRRYAAVSGDRNPIHLRPLTARPFGFPGPIAHGMWTFARCLAEQRLPERVRAEAVFAAPVRLPGTVLHTAADGAFGLREPGGGREHMRGAVEEFPPHGAPGGP
ncbi:hypothetical protein C6N75_14340 [Streptomyces solincola]|uniref:MaoC-like domain-containing protein n=1 Tax=Streptomyces solincola TaxID=2100817 RepID=A0A2S9PW31_9ACTN|nr:MaoC/PaaZ C-terminal domain-containing protein [Streptomyces solincola]PRH78547.1 hypothetical protein C6N75_14340 [Streptomyces solincola]